MSAFMMRCATQFFSNVQIIHCTRYSRGQAGLCGPQVKSFQLRKSNATEGAHIMIVLGPCRTGVNCLFAYSSELNVSQDPCLQAPIADIKTFGNAFIPFEVIAVAGQ